jgi:hypothetical protein
MKESPILQEFETICWDEGYEYGGRTSKLFNSSIAHLRDFHSGDSFASASIHRKTSSVFEVAMMSSPLELDVMSTTPLLEIRMVLKPCRSPPLISVS